MEAAAPKASDERKRLLAASVQRAVEKDSESSGSGEYEVVVVDGHRVNHLLHFIVGIFTLGLWWIAWIIIAIFGGERRQMGTVDEAGRVSWKKIQRS